MSGLDITFACRTCDTQIYQRYAHHPVLVPAPLCPRCNGSDR